VSVELRVHPGSGPTLIYLPGLHGDWGLIGAFRRELGESVRFVEFAYPKSEVPLAELGASVRAALAREGVDRGWLLGQSFGSQVAWELLRGGFPADGLVLAGGFVKHPWPWGVALMRAVMGGVPAGVIKPVYSAYSAACNALAGRDPESAAEIMGFAARRGAPEWKAAAWRLRLIAGSDPRPVARETTIPVRYLGGGVDPLVPWPLVTRWLRRECPGYAGEAILPFADHNILGSRPRESAARIRAWVGA
jgi:pimeloyl-ACP methyl ester carboxylesterase